MNAQLLLIFLPLLILGLIIKASQSRWVKGKWAEWTFALYLRVSLDRNLYFILNNISLRLPDGSTTQIDHIVVSKFGIFVIELKNYRGWIYGNETSKNWTQTFGRNRKYPFQNPIRQNYRHVKALAQLTGIPEDYFKPVVAFIFGCKLKNQDKLPPNAGFTGSMVQYIKDTQLPIILDEQVAEIAQAIKDWQKTGAVTNREHIRNLKQRRK